MFGYIRVTINLNYFSEIILLQHLERVFTKTLIAQNIKSIINQYESHGGVAQLVRAQDS